MASRTGPKRAAPCLHPDSASLRTVYSQVGIYLPVYESLLALVARAAAGGSSCASGQGAAPAWWAPLLAAPLARTAAVLAVGPLELARTQAQATAGGPMGPLSALGGLKPGRRRAVRQTGPRAGEPVGRAGVVTPPPLFSPGGARRLARAWTGVGATLARDVPHSALYWAGVEGGRGVLLRRAERPGAGGPEDAGPGWPGGRRLWASVAAGAISGAVASTVTTPLDVVKSRHQLAPLLRGGAGTPGAEAASIAGVGLGSLRGAGGAGQATADVGGLTLWATALKVAREEGARALFTGWAPRALRAAPASAIVLGVYEAGKRWAGVPELT